MKSNSADKQYNKLFKKVESVPLDIKNLANLFGDKKEINNKKIVKLFNDGPVRENAKEIFYFFSNKLKEAMPYLQINHVGSSAIPELPTASDLDIEIIAPPDKFDVVQKLLQNIFKDGMIGKFPSVVLHTCLNEVPNKISNIDVFLVAAPLNPFSQMKTILLNNPNILEEYKLLKERSALLGEKKYHKAKAEFWEEKFEKIINNLKK